MNSKPAFELRTGDNPVIRRFHSWFCHFCRRLFLDADFHKPGTTLANGEKPPVQVIEYWTGTEPVCSACGEKRGMRKADFED